MTDQTEYEICSKCAWDKDDLLACGSLLCVDGKGHEWELTRWQKVDEADFNALQKLTDTWKQRGERRPEGYDNARIK